MIGNLPVTHTHTQVIIRHMYVHVHTSLLLIDFSMIHTNYRMTILTVLQHTLIEAETGDESYSLNCIITSKIHDMPKGT